MKLLLDTHVFIWWAANPEKLSNAALNACEDKSNSLFLSSASIWEMQIKMQIGKMRLPCSLKNLIKQHENSNELDILNISLNHIYKLEELPMHHRDPFDRMLICQSIEEKLVVISKDNVFSDYEVNLLW
ncbi:PIN domain-containing protein [Desulfonema limicola]|uniref:PIN domain-containing protein n=1 Tax=Desulfonema limicola TaxID=45656 RepID=A0A975BE52_9BACT|nr:type II toxin-antitoxin system VapC family toxin [Desulfonema limicola]QTA83615.1 PIN domain-containing protein [Desulfonema limicola]